MFLRIEKGSAVPISRQICDQIAAFCAARSLKPGDQLPSVRELARELAVNQNTVLRVYERLAGEGLLEMRHGQGTFVTANGASQVTHHKSRLVEELRHIGRQALGLGLTRYELHELLDQAITQIGDPAAAAKREESTT